MKYKPVDGAKYQGYSNDKIINFSFQDVNVAITIMYFENKFVYFMPAIQFIPMPSLQPDYLSYIVTSLF